MKTFSTTLGPVRHSSSWKHLVLLLLFSIQLSSLLICLIILRRESQLDERVPLVWLEFWWIIGASPGLVYRQQVLRRNHSGRLALIFILYLSNYFLLC